MLIALALASLALPPQQSIRRLITFEQQDSALESVSSQVASRFTIPDAETQALIEFNLPIGDGVVHTRTVLAMSIASRLHVAARSIDSTGTRFEGIATTTLSGCGGNFCTYGPVGFLTIPVFLANPADLIPTGTVWTTTQSIQNSPFVSTQVLSPGSNAWEAMYGDPRFQVTGGFRDVVLEAWDDASSPTSAELVEFEASVTSTARVVHTVDLMPAPSIEYCTSPTSVSGVRARVAAFGSQQAGTDLLTIRASDLPMGSFSVLFVGTASQNMPQGTTTLCVGGSVMRQGGVVQATQGLADFEIDLSTQSVGDTVYLQAFFRDPVFGIAATNASSFVVTQP